ncbi:MAG TPA: YggS family pyridoxal phosphate-dependent enzyme [Chitinophagaceae bacterium]|nr:YggS family pyridoxal phosphate-dependent enzyme [Chitinophagaceae bacterium]
MAANIAELKRIRELAEKHHAKVVAVSKTKPPEDILGLYEAGHRIFGENYVQELLEKQRSLPLDIRWHFIGHLQSNKVKYIASFIRMIHSVDNARLLKEISKQAQKTGRVIDCLLQIHIAKEETKFGLDETELIHLLEEVMLHPANYQHIRLCGLMGMATNTPDENVVREEFHYLKALFDKMAEKYISHPEHFTEISMGMSSDYRLAVEQGSTLLRIGSLLFGERSYGPA